MKRAISLAVVFTALATMAVGGVVLPDGTPDPNAASFQLWLSGDAGVLNTSSAPAAIGDVVGTWQNQAATGTAAGVGDAAAFTYGSTTYSTPTLAQADFNGKTVTALHYDGQDQLAVPHHANLSPLTDGLTFFALGKQTSLNTYVDDWFSKGNAGSGSEGYRLYTNVSNGQLYSRVNTANSGDNTGRAASEYTAATVGTVSLMNMTIGPTATPGVHESVMRRNGSTAGWTASDPYYTEDANGVASTVPLAIGANATSNAYRTSFQGDYAEVLVYNTHLPDRDRVAVENYLGSKYGSTSASDLPQTNGLIVHLDAGQVQDDGTGHAQVWPNRATGGMIANATQAVAASRPQIVAGALNGEPALRFDGGNDYMQIGSNPGRFDGDTFTWFLVKKPDDPSRHVDVLLRSNYDNSTAMWGTYHHQGTVYSHGRNGGWPAAPLAAEWQVLSAEWDSSDTVRQFINGLPAGTGGADLTATGHNLTRIGANTAGSPADYWDGDLAEVVIYNTDLSDVERMNVENHLGRKYGATPSSDLPLLDGLVVHLDAAHVQDDGTGHAQTMENRASGGMIRNASQATASARPTIVPAAINGQPVLYFDTNDQLTIPDDDMLDPGAGGLTVFIAGQTDTTGLNCWIEKGNASSSVETGYSIFTSGSWTKDVTIRAYDGSGLANRMSHGVDADLGQPHIVTARFDGSTVNGYLDGVSGGWSGLNTYTQAIESTEPLVIGGINGRSDYWLQGAVAEVIVYKEALDTPDRVAVENYLKLKYGAIAPTDSPVTDDLVVHLDAAHITPDASGNVEVWNNRAGAEHSAIQTTSGYRPQAVASSIGGLPALRFDGSNDFMSIADADVLDPGSGGFTVIMVGEADKSTLGCWLSKGNRGSGDEGYTLWSAMGHNQNLTVRARDTSNVTLSVSTDPLQPYVLTSLMTGTQLQGFLNGSSAGWPSATTYGSNIATADDILIGKRPVDNSYIFKGDMAEVMIFSDALSMPERVAVENHLQLKYGFIPTTDAPVTNGLVAHLDADYVTTDSNGNVEVWNNRAGANHSAIQANSAHRPTVTPNARMGHNAVTFPGGTTGTYDFLSIPDHDDLDVGPNGYTIFMVGQAADGDLHAWLTKGNSGSTHNGYSLWSTDAWGGGTDNMAMRAGNGTQTWTVGQETDPTGLYVVELLIDNNEIHGFLNGVEFDDVLTYTGSLANANDLLIGARLNASYWFEGNMFETLLYNRALDRGESYDMTRYLMDKYNVPEPTSLALLGGALVALARRRKRK